MHRAAGVCAVLGTSATLAACGGSGAAKQTVSNKSISTCCPPGTKIHIYEGKLLTVRQVEDAFAAQGYRLRPFVSSKPLLGFEVANGLPDRSFIWVGIATSRSSGAPSFVYAVGTPKPKRVVVKNVGIAYHVSRRVLLRLDASLAALRREARG
jgi:hypothetical protein